MNLSSSIAASSSTASSPIASKSPGILTASVKPESRMSINPSSFDAASTSQVRLKDAYFGGLMEKPRRNASHQEEESEDSDNPEAEIWYYKGKQVTGKPLPRTVMLGSNPLHTEPVLQLMRKVKRIQKRHGNIISKYRHTHPIILHGSCLIHGQEDYGRQLGDPMNDLDVNLAIWRMFMNTTLRAAVHLGKDYDANLRCVKNHLWKTAGQLFRETEKLVSCQTETTGVNVIDFQDKRWVSTSFLHSRAHQYATAKVHVFSDSVLCLGKMGDDPVESWKSKIQWCSDNNYFSELNRKDGQLMEFEWTIFTGFTTVGILNQIQQLMG